MKPSMGITKIAAFRFLLLLHLFLKVKMCVGFADAAAVAVAAGDSDINYDDSDEWVEEKERVRPAWASSLPPTVPAPASLMRWDGPDPPRRGHSGHPPRMHHVRHEQHYLKHGSVQLSGRSGAGSGGMVAPEPGPYYAHTVTTTTVTGPQPNLQRHAPDRVHHHKHQQHQQQQRHNHQLHHNHHHQHHTKTVSVSQTGGIRDWQVPPGPSEVPNGLSAWRGSRSAQEPVSQKSATETLRDATPGSNALSGNAGSAGADGVGKSSQRAMNPHSKKYFEDLLTDYKRRSPYYKELHRSRDRPQTKALVSGKGKPRGGPDATKRANAKLAEPDYDYLYDDETDEDVQNDATYGGEAATSTKAPTTTTTTTTTTTAAKPTSTTTARSARSYSGEDDESVDGDRGYATYLKNAYAMQSNPARRGNNRFSSSSSQQPRPDLAPHNQHSRREMANQVRQSDDYPPLTRYKMANYGTPEAVSKSYRAYRPKPIINSSEVMSHIARINSEGSCKYPKPMVVPASSDRSKLYYPSCTILHRCDDHAGCCMATETCAPKATATVELYFFVSNVGSRRREAVALSFVNHTECHCVQQGHGAHAEGDRRSVSTKFAWDSSGSSEGSTGDDIPSCKCPELFKPIFDHGSKCYCDCVSSTQLQDCIRFKEGLEHFSMQTRAKILSNQLKAPSCEYGAYLRQEGRCPTKSERMDTLFSRYR